MTGQCLAPAARGWRFQFHDCMFIFSVVLAGMSAPASTLNQFEFGFQFLSFDSLLCMMSKSHAPTNTLVNPTSQLAETQCLLPSLAAKQFIVMHTAARLASRGVASCRACDGKNQGRASLRTLARSSEGLPCSVHELHTAWLHTAWTHPHPTVAFSGAVGCMGVGRACVCRGCPARTQVASCCPQMCASDAIRTI